MSASNITSSGKKKRRAKIRLEFAEKLFYEKVLQDWKESCADRNQSFIIKKALDNLKLFPINVNGYSELRKIKGIGENIATRLDAAWKNACVNHFECDLPTLVQVRTLKKGQFITFLEMLLSLRVDVMCLSFPSKDDDENVVLKTQPVFRTQSDSDVVMNELAASSSNSFHSSLVTTASSSNIAAPTSDDYDPANFDENRLVLIVDGREKKLNVKHEVRTLSVGDYLWVMKLGDSNEKELVLDYVIERKTWDDLKSSIRQTRYMEQKRRLKEAGIRNVILVAEGLQTLDRGLEQALVTTSVDSRFLVHRTMNAQGTAKFLQTVTGHLMQRLKKERMYGPSFSALQDASRKTKMLTVSDCWLRQLTVCPMMSAERAQQVSMLFPTMRSLVEFYRKNSKSAEPVDPATLLQREFPDTIPRSLSAQLSLFFSHAVL
uniref:Crossover junction endonuclease MUS81 n=1 Tax=Ditylenchus dipsaci TaxID=166011 RepID=A0A915CYC6_9BILA